MSNIAVAQSQLCLFINGSQLSKDSPTGTKFRYSRLSNLLVVVWTLERKASESSLYIEAALTLRARVASSHTFINI